ncbi:unnamed protein product [Sphagnum jensenii]
MAAIGSTHSAINIFTRYGGWPETELYQTVAAVGMQLEEMRVLHLEESECTVMTSPKKHKSFRGVDSDEGLGQVEEDKPLLEFKGGKTLDETAPVNCQEQSVEGGIFTPHVPEKELFTGDCNNWCWSLAMTRSVEEPVLSVVPVEGQSLGKGIVCSAAPEYKLSVSTPSISVGIMERLADDFGALVMNL